MSYKCETAKCLVSISVIFCIVLGPLAVDGAATRECMGTNNGLSYTFDFQFHYLAMRLRYLGCTHVIGNLEITHLSSSSITYDLDFLKTIRYVSGYVLIALNEKVSEIPLDSLRVIRGNNTYSPPGASGGRQYALIVAGNQHFQGGNIGCVLKRLKLQSLIEVSNGDVYITDNPCLEFVTTVDWSLILRGRTNGVNYEGPDAYDPFFAYAYFIKFKRICPYGAAWGETSNDCQASSSANRNCPASCNMRCYDAPGSNRCCHSACAGGCTGPANTQCKICMDFKLDNACVGSCPSGFSAKGQKCKTRLG